MRLSLAKEVVALPQMSLAHIQRILVLAPLAVIDLGYEYHRHHDLLEATGVWGVSYSYLIDKVRSLQAQPQRSAGNCFSLLFLTKSS
jgi:hypothetical protein